MKGQFPVKPTDTCKVLNSQLQTNKNNGTLNVELTADELMLRQ
jgi:hypothetical protein